MNKYRIENPCVLWTLTNECNIGCNYCYQNSDNSKREELPFKRKMELIDEMIDIGVEAITFTGGEPLLRMDELCSLSDYANNKGLEIISVLTSGTLLSNNVIKKLRNSGVKKFHINFDCFNREIYDSFRRRKDCWEKALGGIISSLEEGMKTEIMATLTKRNFSEIEKLIQFGRGIGAEIGIETLVPIGRGKYMKEECLEKEQIKSLFKTVMKYSFDGNSGIRMATNPEFIPYLKREAGKNIEKSNYPSFEYDIGCMAGVGWCAIQPDGLVTPCSLIPDVVAGDLKEKSFVDVWKNAPLFKKLRNRDNLKGSCGKCENKYECGGCRAKAYALTNDLLEGDPNCVLHSKN